MTQNTFYAVVWLKAKAFWTLPLCLSVHMLTELKVHVFGIHYLATNEPERMKWKGWYITARHLRPLKSWCTALFQGIGHGCTEREKGERDAIWWEKVRSVVKGNVRSIQPALTTEITNTGLSEADDFWIASGEITVCPCEVQPYLAADKRCEFRPAHFRRCF